VVASTMDLLGWLRKHLEEADTDLLRELVATFVQALMDTEADAACGAAHGERSAERVNQRNGYRSRRLDTRVGTLELAIPKLRQGSYFPDWLLEPRRRAERALVAVVAECYVRGVSTRRVEGLVQTLGIQSLSKSQVSELAKSLDSEVAAFRARPLDAGPYAYIWVDALAVKCREAGRIVNVAAVIATGVGANGYREILGVDVLTTEDGAGWTSFLRDLVARGLHGVQLVISDAHRGLVEAVAAVLAGSSWQRCRTHFMRITCYVGCLGRPRGWSPRWCARCSPSRMRPPPTPSTPVSSSNFKTGSPRRPSCWSAPLPTCWPSPASPRSTGGKSGRTIPRSG
jgi:putative transposase